MESRKIPQKIEGQKLGMLIFECVMAVLYLLFGIALLFTSLFENAISGWVRIALGGLLGVYGIFRIARAVKKLA